MDAVATDWCERLVHVVGAWILVGVLLVMSLSFPILIIGTSN